MALHLILNSEGIIFPQRSSASPIYRLFYLSPLLFEEVPWLVLSVKRWALICTPPVGEYLPRISLYFFCRPVRPEAIQVKYWLTGPRSAVYRYYSPKVRQVGSLCNMDYARRQYLTTFSARLLSSRISWTVFQTPFWVQKCGYKGPLIYVAPLG